MNDAPQDRLFVIQGDITKLDVDAIVNAANSTLLGGGGVDGAIHRAAGPELTAACLPLGGCPTGLAKVTPGFRLAARYVIHTVGPVWGEGGEPEKLRRAVWNVLTLAELYNLRSVSIPAISSGVFGFPKPLCAEILLATTAEFLKQPAVRLDEVVMCNHDRQTTEIFLAAARSFLAVNG